MIPDLIPLPYKIGILLCAAAVIAFGSYYKGYNNANAKYIAVKVQLDSERAQAKADADQAKLDADRVTLDVSNRWADAVAILKRNPVIRVLPARSCVSDSNAGTTYGLNATPQTTPADPRTITAEECEAYLTDAIEDSTRLVWLQHWIREQR